MKRLLVLLMCVVMAGCAGSTIQPDKQTDKFVDTAFQALLIIKPELKPEIVAQLKNIQGLLDTDISYKTLMAEITKRFPEEGKYAQLAALLIPYFNMDAPISEDWLNMFDGTKKTLKLKIDHLLLLAGG